MFKHGLIAMMMVLAASAARAVTIQWTVPCVTDDFLSSTNSTVYLLSSSSSAIAGPGGWPSSSDTWNSAQSSYGVDDGVTATEVSFSGYAGGGVFAGSNGYNETDIFLNVGNLEANNYYALVFVSKGNTSATGSYAVTNSVQYTTKGDSGFADVDINGVPTYADFLDISWLASNYVGTPEPTVFALLALGVAGLSLRRRTR